MRVSRSGNLDVYCWNRLVIGESLLSGFCHVKGLMLKLEVKNRGYICKDRH
jgi:hypothetical protein